LQKLFSIQIQYKPVKHNDLPYLDEIASSVVSHGDYLVQVIRFDCVGGGRRQRNWNGFL